MPKRATPMAYIFARVSKSRIPPEALILMALPTKLLIRDTVSMVAPPGNQPVDVLTNAAPAFIPNMPVTTAPIPQPGSGWWIGDYNGMVVDNQFAHMVWNDTRAGR